MIKKIKDFFLEMLCAPTGAALTVFAIMLLLSLFNLINSVLLFQSNAWMLLMLPISFLLPFFMFRASRGGSKYLPTQHLSFPSRIHIPTIIFSSALLISGSLLLKLLSYNGKYTEFSMYSAFFAHRNGNVWNDMYLLCAFCLIPPILEGLVFRGILIKEHERRGRLTATVFSSLFFALLSFNSEELLPRFFIGALLCIVLFATDSIFVTVTMHIAYNIFAVFFEPTLISIKNVSSNFELFAFITAIFTFVMAIFLFSHLSRLYKKYSHDKFGENFIKSTPRERTFWHLCELLLSIPAIACYFIFIIVALIIQF